MRHTCTRKGTTTRPRQVAAAVGRPVRMRDVLRALLLPLLWGCGGGGNAEPIPESLEAFLRPASVRAEEVSRGVWYRAIRSPVGPWAVHLLEVDLDRCELGF